MRVRHCLLLIPMLLLTACALGEGPSPTPPPPLTVGPPPTLTFSGDCVVSRELADWLQYSTYYVTRFTELLTQAGSKRAGEMYEDVVMMSRMRDDFGGIATPDCAEPAQRLIVVTMTRAIESFQAYVNGESSSLDNTVAEALGQFDQVNVIQKDLNTRLEAQLREQQTGQ
ncbi:MAG: hypothetical protein K8J31_14760 [Anaerolineae bacterium]|nr:hypothetical protein [Anaerolineae bacterium]